MHLQLGVAVAAVLEAKRLELVVARCQLRGGRLQVAPGVARGVLRAVDAEEGAHAVVGVHAEGVGTRSVVYAEWDADVEADVLARAVQADVLVAQCAGGRQRPVAVSLRLGHGLGAHCKLCQRSFVRAATGGRIEVAVRGIKVDAPEDHGLVGHVAGRVAVCLTAAGATIFAPLARLDGGHELRRLRRAEADRALVERVQTAAVHAAGAGVARSRLPAERVGLAGPRVRVAGRVVWVGTVGLRALEHVLLSTLAPAEAPHHRQAGKLLRDAERVQRPVREAELAADDIGDVVVVPHPVAAHGAPLVPCLVEDLDAALPAGRRASVRAAQPRSLRAGICLADTVVDTWLGGRDTSVTFASGELHHIRGAHATVGAGEACVAGAHSGLEKVDAGAAGLAAVEVKAVIDGVDLLAVGAEHVRWACALV